MENGNVIRAFAVEQKNMCIVLDVPGQKQDEQKADDLKVQLNEIPNYIQNIVCIDLTEDYVNSQISNASQQLSSMKLCRVEAKFMELDDANNTNRHEHKDSDCICNECLQDRQYLIWELEA